MIATPIRISKIIIPKNRRKINEEVVKSLMESIETIGLLNPITTCNENILIAGLHRLEAFKRLGRKEIDCNRLGGNYLNYELAEIDENLIRNELSVLEKTELLERRKELYEEMHPETKHGTNRFTNNRVTDSVTLKPIDNFVNSTSKLTGKSPTTIREEISISKNLTPEVKEMIYNEPIADKKTELLKLSKQKPEIQKEIAEKIVNKEISKVDEYFQEEKLDKREEVDYELLDFKNDILTTCNAYNTTKSSKCIELILTIKHEINKWN